VRFTGGSKLNFICVDLFSSWPVIPSVLIALPLRSGCQRATATGFYILRWQLHCWRVVQSTSFRRFAQRINSRIHIAIAIAAVLPPGYTAKQPRRVLRHPSPPLYPARPSLWPRVTTSANKSHRTRSGNRRCIHQLVEDRQWRVAEATRPTRAVLVGKADSPAWVEVKTCCAALTPEAKAEFRKPAWLWPFTTTNASALMSLIVRQTFRGFPISIGCLITRGCQVKRRLVDDKA